MKMQLADRNIEFWSSKVKRKPVMEIFPDTLLKSIFHNSFYLFEKISAIKPQFIVQFKFKMHEVTECISTKL